MATTCGRVSTIPSLLHHPLPIWQGFYSQPRRELSGDGRGRRREWAESHVLRACLPASPGPASSSSGRSVEWDKRTGSNSSAQAWKKHPQMKLKSHIFWPHQMLGATQSISQCERHSGKARDSLTDHLDSFQCLLHIPGWLVRFIPRDESSHPSPKFICSSPATSFGGRRHIFGLGSRQKFP